MTLPHFPIGCLNSINNDGGGGNTRFGCEASSILYGRSYIGMRSSSEGACPVDAHPPIFSP